MNPKCIALCIGVSTLLVGTASCGMARGLGSNPPIIGDHATASKLIMLGNNDLAIQSWAAAKAEFQLALKSCPFDEDAYLGLARCATGVGDSEGAVINYGHVVRGNEEDIDLLTEYGLALQTAGHIAESIKNYNYTLDRCKNGLTRAPMDMYPYRFRTDGTDYTSSGMAAMYHLIRALNSGGGNDEREASEFNLALLLAPHSSIVYYYKGVLLQIAKKPEARLYFERALALDDGEYAQAIMRRLAVPQK